MHTVYLSLGSNQGDSEKLLKKAVKMLQKPLQSLVASSIYRTKAWGKTDQPDFLNLVVRGETTLSPLELLDQTQSIEKQLHRVRKERWGPRTMDIDILLYDDLRLDSERLKIPHPYMLVRDFVLIPLLEIAPELSFEGKKIPDFIQNPEAVIKL